MPASFYSREVIAFIIYVLKAISTAMKLACETWSVRKVQQCQTSKFSNGP